jgi:hypothetical protein
MPDTGSDTSRDDAVNEGWPGRIFIFKSEGNVGLQAFSGDPVGMQLPSQFKPWHAIGVIAPDGDPPYNLSRAVIEKAIHGQGFQLFRRNKKA